MSPGRAGAAYPDALSFARNLLRKAVRGRWRVETLRLALDREGRGEALYRVAAEGRAFHFLVLSTPFPQDEKIDRAFGVNWDVSAALCQGPWTADREDELRRQVPLQYDGRYDPEVLCFCRGNRSERLFDDVVASLAAGAQPAVAPLASVGYILRSTAFAGNGLFGMMPFEGFEEGHPLGRPYDAQILAAYLLRHFVFDLVDHLARACSPAAVRLDPAVKRYLGLGNSAGLGLIPFTAGHPQIIHRWCAAHEDALVAALGRVPSGAELVAYAGLVDKAVRHFGEDGRDGNGIFLSGAALAAELARAATLIRPGRMPGRWDGILAPALAEPTHPEAAEILRGLLLELYPDIVATHQGALAAAEEVDLDPAMTAGQVLALLDAGYGWVPGRQAGDDDWAWYYPLESPYEPRRARRDRAGRYAGETAMDGPVRVADLRQALAAGDPAERAGLLAARRPDLRAAIARVQSLAAHPYGELRVNTLAADFAPFASCRFLLAFYGMEKFDPRPPRSTKGALLQGAPLAEDIAAGRDGDWPFPLLPRPVGGSSGEPGLPAAPLRNLESPDIPIERVRAIRGRSGRDRSRDGEVTLFPAELRKLLGRAAAGAGLGLAGQEACLRLVTSAAGRGTDGLPELLEALAPVQAEEPRLAAPGRIDGRGGPDVAAAAMVLDLAGALAAGQTGPGIAAAIHVAATPLLPGLPLWSARRGQAAILVDGEPGEVWVAAPGPDGPWLAGGAGLAPDWALAALAGRSAWSGLSSASDLLAPSASASEAMAGGFALLVLPDAPSGLEGAARRLGWRLWTAGEVGSGERRVAVDGLRVPAVTFTRLSGLAKRALVPPAFEPMLLAPVEDAPATPPG